MVVRFTEKATHDYADAPADVGRAFKKQLGLLLANLRHPSLRAKKCSEAEDVWQARVNRNWRFCFAILGDTYEIITIIPRPR